MALALTAFHLAVMVIAAAIFIAAAVSDIRSYRIPNYLCALLLALFPIFALTSPTPIDWQNHLIVFGVVVVCGFALYAAKWIGAGDIKLLSVASLWAGPQLIAILLVVTAFVGGVESLILAAWMFCKQEKSDQKKSWGKTPIPYGVAIATGGVVILSMMAQPILLPS